MTRTTTKNNTNKYGVLSNCLYNLDKAISETCHGYPSTGSPAPSLAPRLSPLNPTSPKVRPSLPPSPPPLSLSLSLSRSLANNAHSQHRVPGVPRLGETRAPGSEGPEATRDTGAPRLVSPSWLVQNISEKKNDQAKLTASNFVTRRLSEMSAPLLVSTTTQVVFKRNTVVFFQLK